MKLWLLGIWLLYAAGAFAQGLQTPFYGIKQSAMGGTGVSNPLDGSAMASNPGGLSFTHNNSLNLHAQLRLPKFQYKGEGTNVIDELGSGSTFPFAGYWAWSPKPAQPWKLGLAVSSPYNSKMDWGTTWAGRYVLNNSKLVGYQVQPTFSFNIKERLGVGAGFVYSRAVYGWSQSLPVALPSGVDGQSRLQASGNGFGFNAGIILRVHQKFDVGVAYKSALKHNLKGTASFTAPTSLADQYPETDISSSLTLPWVLDAGFTYRPEPKMAVSVEVSYIGTKVYDEVVIDYARETDLVKDLAQPKQLQNCFTLKLGGSYQIDSSFTLRAGTYLGLSPVQDGFVSPEMPLGDVFGITLGGTLHTSERFGLDVAFTYQESVRRREFAEGNFAALGGTYKGRTIAISVALNFNLGKKPKLPETAAPITPEPVVEP